MSIRRNQKTTGKDMAEEEGTKSLDFICLPDPGEWDTFVCNSPQCNPFAGSTWLKEIARATGLKVDLWALTRKGTWLAAVPVFYRTKSGCKQARIPPLTVYNSCIFLADSGHHPARRTSLQTSIAGRMIDHFSTEYSNLHHLLHPTVNDVRPWQWAGWQITPHYTYWVDLTADLRLSRSARKNIRKCEEKGFAISFEWDLDKFWRVYEITINRQAFDIGMSKASFIELADALHDGGMAFMATAVSNQGDIAASRIQLYYPGKDVICDWVAGSDPGYMSAGVNPWLMARIADQAREADFKLWDLCGADFESISRFKSEFGGRLTLYFQVRAPLSPVQKTRELLRRFLGRARTGAGP
jgi:hypothetical protein